MIIFDRTKALSDIDRINEITFEEIKFTQINDYLDGPLEGLCFWKNKEYYFIWSGEMNEDTDEIVRRFFLLTLDDSQIKAEKEEYANFIKAKENGKLDKFFEQQKKENLEIDIKQVIGWFGRK